MTATQICAVADLAHKIAASKQTLGYVLSKDVLRSHNPQVAQEKYEKWLVEQIMDAVPDLQS